MGFRSQARVLYPTTAIMEVVFYLFLLCGLGYGAPLSGDDGSPYPVVRTLYGDVMGRRMVHDGRAIEEFKGIPFGKPPVGPLRWQRPQEPDAWRGVFDAREYGEPCTQYSRSYPNNGEDCLFVNVYVPNGVNITKKSPLPVMVWTYGGGYQTGASQIYPCHELALTGDVVIVSHNYRVSVLGGLASSDVNSPGNYMLWDARAALLWVRANIKNFGGDPSRVTIFGASAGGAIVSHLMASPVVDGLFHRAITLSGAAAGPIGIQHNHLENTKNVAILEECPHEEGMKRLVDCLRTRNATDLDQSGYPSMAILSGQLPGWGPVVDGEFVVKRPEEAFQNGDASKVDYISGRTHDDAAGFIYMNMRGLPGDFGNVAATHQSLYLAATYLLQSYRPNGDTDGLIEAVIKRYPGISSDNVTTRTEALCRAITDFVWTAPTHLEADGHFRGAKQTGKKTFVYNFRYRPSFVQYEPWVTGSHTDDHYLVFGQSYRRKLRETRLGNFSAEDSFVSQSLMKYYANFAYSGDPNGGPHKVPTKWPEYDPEAKQYLQMGAEMEATKVDPKLQALLDFWLKEWPTLVDPNYINSSPSKEQKDNGFAIDTLVDMAADFILSMGSTE